MSGRFPATFGAHLTIASLVLLADQISKALIARAIPLHETVPVIPGFFRLSHVWNRGAAFSLFAQGDPMVVRLGLIAFSALICVALLAALWRMRRRMGRTALALSLVLGGATGNLLDRVFRGSVVDFLAFQLGPYHWPDFNLADSTIVIGALLLVLDVIWGGPASPPSVTAPE
jgi:signal peptidase II